LPSVFVRTFAGNETSDRRIAAKKETTMSLHTVKIPTGEQRSKNELELRMTFAGEKLAAQDDDLRRNSHSVSCLTCSAIQIARRRGSNAATMHIRVIGAFGDTFVTV
jgi:hypothetical protein